MKHFLLLTLLCLPTVFLLPHMYEETVEEPAEERSPSDDEGTLVKIADEDDDDQNLEEDIVDINKEVEGKLGGHIKDPVHRDWKVYGDIMYRGCEELAKYGISECPNKKKKKTSKKHATTRADSKWILPVPYTIDGLGDKAKKAIKQAIDEFKLKTCVSFRDKLPTDPNYLRFYKGDGCHTPVGRDPLTQSHDISLGDRCEYKKTAIHEIMHALGFYHEQSRPDRDNHVFIHWNRINLTHSEKQVNFGKETRDVTDYGFDYDYRSIMHYSKTAFGKEVNDVYLETITPTINTELGQCWTCGFSRTDALQVNARYCNEPKDDVDTFTLRSIAKRWMAIYNGDSNADFRVTFLKHLRKIYPDYWFTVSAYDGIRGYDKHKIIGASDGCIWIWRYYSRNLVICFSKKIARFPSYLKIDQIMREVVNQVKERGCDAERIADAAYPLINAYGYDVRCVHVVIHGNGLRTTWDGYGGFSNFKCSSRNQASLVVTFGSA